MSFLPLSYVTSGAWGSSTTGGAILPAASIDNNFWLVSQAYNTLQGQISTLVPVGISSILSPTAGTITFTLTNGQTYGPFTIPSYSPTFRGAWAANTVYNTNDIITAAGATYIVLENITSASSFDPTASDGNGNAVYGLLLQAPGTVLPVGGTTGQALVKNSSTNYDISWATISGLPTGGTINQVLSKNSSTNYDVSWVTFAYTLAGATDVSITSPANNDVLQYNSGASKWKNTSFATFQSSLAISGVQLEDTLYTGLSTTGTVSWDPTAHPLASVVPTGAITLNASAAGSAGNRAVLQIVTSGTSSFNVTPTTSFKSQGALATGTSSGKVFMLEFLSDGTNWNELSRTTAM